MPKSHGSVIVMFNCVLRRHEQDVSAHSVLATVSAYASRDSVFRWILLPCSKESIPPLWCEDHHYGDSGSSVKVLRRHESQLGNFDSPVRGGSSTARRQTSAGFGDQVCLELRNCQGIASKIWYKKAISSHPDQIDHQHNNHKSSNNFIRLTLTPSYSVFSRKVGNNPFKMFFKTAIFTAVAALAANGVMAAAVPQESDAPAEVSIMIATDAYYACNCPNNCDYTQGSSCKYLSGPSSGDSSISGSKFISSTKYRDQ